MFRVPPGQALRTAAAVECIHAYSLVHDDLPCMDDDDLRRGQPTVHVKWDEATAVLAGDALQALAFEVLAAPQGGIEPRLQVRLMLRLAQAAGAHGHGGRAGARHRGREGAGAARSRGGQRPAGAEDRGALRLGGGVGRDPRAAGRRAAAPLCGRPSGSPTRSATTSSTWRAMPEAAGKRLRKDEARGKATFVSLLGVEAARARRRVTWWRRRATVSRPTARRPGTCGWRRSSSSDAAADGARGG